MRKYTLKTTNLSDTESVSEVFYDEEEDATEPIANVPQPSCNDIADVQQPSCSDIAEVQQPSCSDIADVPQTPQRQRRTPPKPINPALVSFLADDKNFQKSVYGEFSDLENMVKCQKGAPDYMAKYLMALGFQTNVDELTRYVIPQARVQRVQTILGHQIKAWQKVSGILAVLIILLWIMWPSQTADRVVADMPTPKGKDSAITWNELNEMLRVYNANSSTKIWYAPPLYREINEKNISDVSEIKKLFDQRAEEIKRVQNH